MFEGNAEVEKRHEIRYKKLLENIEKGKVFKKDGKVFWKCRNCGYIHDGSEAPEICPVCRHEQAYFELWAENDEIENEVSARRNFSDHLKVKHLDSVLGDASRNKLGGLEYFKKYN